MLKDYFNRVEKMDNLIRRKATGAPVDFADRLGISKSRLYDYLRLLKEIGAPVCYSKSRRTYFYKKEGAVVLCFKTKN